jgi:pimeloyl-ACP methyl ester carboxylesterase
MALLLITKSFCLTMRASQGSGGETPASVLEMMHDCVAFLRALGLEKIDGVGFSMGGMIAQQLMLDHPALVRRTILLGTGPRGGEGMTFTELSADGQADPEAFLLAAFFSPSDASRAAGKAFMERLKARKEDRDPPVSTKTAEVQLKAKPRPPRMERQSPPPP